MYFVHNRVRTIQKAAERVRRLIPQARVAVGHGQMSEDQLATVMVDFEEGKWDILVCTTIIESGLDIPNVNTIIVERADRFGLAQLYQLRGRVGRSGRRAYAYFLYDPRRSLTEQADKRLDVISGLHELGQGFKIALRDLEIRGEPAGYRAARRHRRGWFRDVPPDAAERGGEAAHRLGGDGGGRCPLHG